MSLPKDLGKYCVHPQTPNKAELKKILATAAYCKKLKFNEKLYFLFNFMMLKPISSS